MVKLPTKCERCGVERYSYGRCMSLECNPQSTPQAMGDGFDPDCDDLRDLVAPVPRPTAEQIKVGLLALDDYFNGAKDADEAGSVALVYRAMKALETPSPAPSSAKADYDDEVSPEVIARLQAMADEIMGGQDWITAGKIEWPDEANKSIEYFVKLSAKQRAIIETLKEALREIAQKGVTTGYGRAALAHIARRALADGGKG